MKLLHLLLTAAAASAQFFGTSPSNPTPQTRHLDITADVTFLPTPLDLSSKPRLVNGVKNSVNVRVANLEAEPIIVSYIGASLVDTAKNVVVKNFTSMKIGTAVEHGLQLDKIYTFTADMAEQEVNLVIAVVVTTPAHEVVSVQAYNGTVLIVEPEASIFDPQMSVSYSHLPPCILTTKRLFLYLLLAAGFTGTLYFVYNTWIASVAPKQKRKFDAPKPVAPVVLAPGTGSGYDAGWIPEHHLKRPQTKTKGSSGPTGGRKGRKVVE